MLDQYFSTKDAQERMQQTLYKIVQPDADAKILVFRGPGGNGKTTFYSALKQAVKEKAGKDVIMSETSEMKFSPKMKEPNSIVVHETNSPEPIETNDAGFDRRIVDFHFDQHQNKPRREIVAELKAYLLTWMGTTHFVLQLSRLNRTLMFNSNSSSLSEMFCCT